MTLLTDYEILGVSYLVDVDRDMLLLVEDPEIGLSFKNMHYTDTHYLLKYNRLSPVDGDNSKVNPGQIVDVPIPHKVILNPVAMARKYGVTVEALKGRTDYDVMVDQDLLNQRINGKLPEISIAGSDFIYDIKLNALLPKDKIGGNLMIGPDVYLSEDEMHYTFLYNPVKREIVHYDRNMVEFSAGVFMAKIPNQLRLDPYGMIEKLGLHVKDTLVKFPIQKSMTAQLTPLSELYFFKALVLKNRERLIVSDKWISNRTSEKNKTTKKVKKKNKGNRL
ncbi:hypothetical protein [Pedobacter sp. WC2423]|uniref:hypothetical protein n=1 Tax=Pedobacter sp. WC2423 TaxID=3234142 RepID=UPI003466BBDB